LHVAALLDSEVKSERIQAWAVQFNWNDVLAIMRRLYPSRQFIDDLPGMGKILTTTDDTLARELLKKWAQQDDWINLDDGIRETLESIA